MTGSAVAAAFELLERSARKRVQALRGRKARVTVQVGHCSRSVGAVRVADKLAASLPDTAYLAIAGCDGACFDAPQVLVTDLSGRTRRYARVTPESAGRIVDELSGDASSGEDPVSSFLSGQRRITLDGCGRLAATDIDEYLVHGGYAGLARALRMTPEEIIEEVKASGLRGRGGAYFPASAKWESVRATNRSPRYLVVNAEEGEPGIFKDRHLMEGMAHRVLEGMIVAAYASGAEKAFLYINAEPDLSSRRMREAIDQANSHGILGSDILGSGFGLEVEIRRGAGGYICGEETTLLSTIEGYRREPRLRPPFPTESGLWARPTVINNPETLAGVTYIMANGAQGFAGIGTDTDKGTKIVSISGSVRRPGIVEVPMGTTLRHIVADLGRGPLPGHELIALAVGGPSSGVLPPSMLDTPIRGGLLHEPGVMLGAGGVIVLDDRIGIPEVIRKLAAYNAAESCGKCTPCREGTPRMVEALDRLSTDRTPDADLDDLRYLVQIVGPASLCGLGQAAGNPITSALHFFGDEVFSQARAPTPR